MEIKRFQNSLFKLVEVDEIIQNYFRDLKVITKEEELYKLSTTIEPRASLSEKNYAESF